MVCQADGSPGSRKSTTRMVCDFARFPVFRQSVGFGRDRFRYLNELVRTPVGASRTVDDTGFFPVGADPRAMPDGELYDRLMGGFPRWLAEARRLGIVRSRPGPVQTAARDSR